jgi:recombinational DNA repair protein (RecF pathway)
MPKLIWIIFKNSVRTAKKTQLFTITKINWLTLFKEIIAVYCKSNHAHKMNYLLLSQVVRNVTTGL